MNRALQAYLLTVTLALSTMSFGLGGIVGEVEAQTTGNEDVDAIVDPYHEAALEFADFVDEGNGINFDESDCDGVTSGDNTFIDQYCTVVNTIAENEPRAYTETGDSEATAYEGIVQNGACVACYQEATNRFAINSGPGVHSAENGASETQGMLVANSNGFSIDLDEFDTATSTEIEDSILERKDSEGAYVDDTATWMLLDFPYLATSNSAYDVKYPDEEPIDLSFIHIKYPGDRGLYTDPVSPYNTAYSNLDDDQDRDFQEFSCAGEQPFTNPTNPDAHCDDYDGDGIPNDEDDEPTTPHIPQVTGLTLNFTDEPSTSGEEAPYSTGFTYNCSREAGATATIYLLRKYDSGSFSNVANVGQDGCVDAGTLNSVTEYNNDAVNAKTVTYKISTKSTHDAGIESDELTYDVLPNDAPVIQEFDVVCSDHGMNSCNDGGHTQAKVEYTFYVNVSSVGSGDENLVQTISSVQVKDGTTVLATLMSSDGIHFTGTDDLDSSDSLSVTAYATDSGSAISSSGPIAIDVGTARPVIAHDQQSDAFEPQTLDSDQVVVRATVTDQDAHARAAISVTLNYSINGGAWTFVGMGDQGQYDDELVLSQNPFASGPSDSSDGFVFEHGFSGLGEGDIVRYYFEATDGTFTSTLRSADAPFQYEIQGGASVTNPLQGGVCDATYQDGDDDTACATSADTSGLEEEACSAVFDEDTADPPYCAVPSDDDGSGPTVTIPSINDVCGIGISNADGTFPTCIIEPLFDLLDIFDVVPNPMDVASGECNLPAHLLSAGYTCDSSGIDIPGDFSDVRDTDGDGDRNETNSQVDAIETFVAYYEYRDGRTNMHIFTPGVAVKAPDDGDESYIIHVGDDDPNDEVTKYVVVYNSDVGTPYTCVFGHEDAANPVIQTTGETEDDCYAGNEFENTQEVVFYDQDISGQTLYEMFNITAENQKPLLVLNDTDKDGVPDQVEVNLINILPYEFPLGITSIGDRGCMPDVVLDNGEPQIEQDEYGGGLPPMDVNGSDAGYECQYPDGDYYISESVAIPVQSVGPGSGIGDVPAAPDYLTASSNDTAPKTSLDLEWNGTVASPFDDSEVSSPHTDFNVYWSTESGVSGRDHDGSKSVSGQNHTTVDGLIPNTTYHFIVAAVYNDGAGEGEGPASEEASNTTAADLTKPDQIADLEADTPAEPDGQTQIDLSWSEVDHPPNTQVVGYYVHYAQGDSVTESDNRTTVEGNTTTTYSVTDLEPGTTYTFAVQAFDNHGGDANVGDLSPAATNATLADNPAPTVPQNLAAFEGDPDNSTTVDLTWDHATDDDSIDHYLVSYAAGTEVPASGADQLEVDGGDNFTTISGLTPETQYAFVVEAFDADQGSGRSDAVLFTTKVDQVDPSTPQGLEAVLNSNDPSGAIDLSWQDSTDNHGAVSYTIKRSADGGDFSVLATGVSATSYADSGLDQGVTYTYKVAAVDSVGNRGGYSDTASARTDPAPDAPTGVEVENHDTDSLGSLDVNWTAAVDNEDKVRNYTVYWSAFSPITTEDNASAPLDNATLDYTISGLDADTTYYVAVIANDTHGSDSPLSDAASASTNDVPGAPTGLEVVQNATTPSSRIDLNWIEAVDDVGGVANYTIYRSTSALNGYTVIAEGVTDLTYTDAGLDAEVQYYYNVSAIDAFGVGGPLSDAVSATTGAETNPPTAPTGIAVVRNGTDPMAIADLSWTAATDAEGSIANYTIYWADHAGIDPATEANTTQTGDDSTDISVSGLTSGATYYFVVSSWDSAGNENATADEVMLVMDETPGAPADVVVSTNATNGYTGLDVSWSAATDDDGIASYTVYVSDQDGFQPATVADDAITVDGNTLQTTLTGLDPGVTYYVIVRATDAAHGTYGGGGNTADSSQASATTDSDDEEPSAPTGLVASRNADDPGTRIDLAWNAATDNGNIDHYEVRRAVQSQGQFFLVGTTGDLAFTDTGLEPDVEYFYVVQAVDSAGNEGDYSNEASLRTSADASPPDAPTGLTAARSGSDPTTVDLDWAHDKTDNGDAGFSHFMVYRSTSDSSGFVAIRDASDDLDDTSMSDSGLDEVTTYYYKVSAVDNADNESPLTAAVSVTTDQAPTAPTGLEAVPTQGSESSSVDLNWTASSDNSAVTKYNIYRDGEFLDDEPGLKYTDETAEPDSTYVYTVEAVDDAGYISDRSNEATVTTKALDPGAMVGSTLDSLFDEDCDDSGEEYICVFSVEGPGTVTYWLGMSEGLKVRIPGIVTSMTL